MPGSATIPVAALHLWDPSCAHTVRRPRRRWPASDAASSRPAARRGARHWREESTGTIVCYTQFGRLLQRPVHALAARYCLHQRDTQGRLWQCPTHPRTYPHTYIVTLDRENLAPVVVARCRRTRRSRRLRAAATRGRRGWPPRRAGCRSASGTSGESHEDARQSHVAATMPSRAVIINASISVGRDHVRRHEINHVADRAQQRLVLEPVAVDAQAATFTPVEWLASGRHSRASSAATIMPHWRTSATCSKLAEQLAGAAAEVGGEGCDCARSRHRWQRCRALPAPLSRPARCRCNCANAGRRAACAYSS